MKKSTYIDITTILAVMSNRKQRRMMKELLPSSIADQLNDDEESNGLAAATATIEMLKAKRA